MRDNWSFHGGGAVYFGNGVIKQIPRLLWELNVKKILMVTDPGLTKAGISGRVSQIGSYWITNFENIFRSEILC